MFVIVIIKALIREGYFQEINKTCIILIASLEPAYIQNFLYWNLLLIVLVLLLPQKLYVLPFI